MWFVCLAVTAAKPPAYAGILLLPLLLVPLRKVPGKAVLLPTAALLVLAAGGVAAKTGLDLLREGPRPEELDAQLRFLCTGQGVATFLSAFLKLFTAEPWLTRWFQPLGWVDTELNDRHLTLLLLSLGLAALFDLFARGPALAAAVRRRPAWAAVLAAVLVAHFLFAALSSALIMYVAETAPGAALIRGFQLRYLFPVIIPFFFVPLALLEGKKAEAGQEAAPAGPGTPLLNSAALCLLPLLLFARQVELTADLLIRYW